MDTRGYTLFVELMNILTQEDDGSGDGVLRKKKILKGAESNSSLSLIDEENYRNKPVFSFKPYCLDPEKIIDDDHDELKHVKQLIKLIVQD